MRPCKGDRYFVCSRCNETVTTNGCEPGNEDKCQDPKAPGGYYYCVYDEHVFKPLSEDNRLRDERDRYRKQWSKLVSSLGQLYNVVNPRTQITIATGLNEEQKEAVIRLREERDSAIADLDEHTKRTAAMAKLVTTVQDEMRDTRDECDTAIVRLATEIYNELSTNLETMDDTLLRRVVLRLKEELCQSR